MSDKKILETSDEAAKFVTGIEGWVDGNGRFWGKDESVARWSGCTHIICPGCQTATPKTYTHCPECREKRAVERYKEQERVKWDGKTPLYSEGADLYFFDGDELEEYISELECSVESLRLVICSPNYLRLVEDDFFCDCLPDDRELPEDVLEALKDLNEVISKQEPISWSPGKYVADLSEKA